MAIKNNLSYQFTNGVKKLLRHTRINSITGELDFYFPMEIHPKNL